MLEEPGHGAHKCPPEKLGLSQAGQVVPSGLSSNDSIIDSS